MAGRHDSLLQRRPRPGLAGRPRGVRLESQRCPHPFRPELACVGAARDQALFPQSLRWSRAGDSGIRHRRRRSSCPRIDESSQLCNSYSSAHAVAHELGHVLGLGHEERGCALMNGRGTWSGAEHCRQEAVWTWRCGLLEPDDINGVCGALRRAHEHHGRGSCPAYAPIQAPVSPRSSIASVRRSADGGIVVLPLLGRAGTATGWRLRPAGAVSSASRCTPVSRVGVGERSHMPETPVRQSARQWSTDALPPGPSASASRWQMRTIGCLRRAAHCYSLAPSTDPLGRPSDQPGDGWITV